MAETLRRKQTIKLSGDLGGPIGFHFGGRADIGSTQCVDSTNPMFEKMPDSVSSTEPTPVSEPALELTREKRLEFVQGFLSQVQSVIETDISERLTEIVRRLLGEHEKKTRAIKEVRESIADDIKEDVDTLADEMRSRTIDKYVQEMTRMLCRMLTGLANGEGRPDSQPGG